MEKTIREFTMNKTDGNFMHVADLYEWLGNIRLSDHKFEINVKIVEKEG